MLKHETEQFERTVRMILDSPSLDNMQKETIERLLSEIRGIMERRNDIRCAIYRKQEQDCQTA